MGDIVKLLESARNDIAKADNLQQLESLRVALLGKKGSLTDAMKSLGNLSGDARKEQGQQLNLVKQEITDLLTKQKDLLEQAELNHRLKAEKIDVTLPPPAWQVGRLHPITQTIDELTAIFGQMGFAVAEGPEIEDDFHNFTALNIPPSHPARQMHDTFYLQPQAEGNAPPVLRTHTSPVQIRALKSLPKPVAVIAPGRTYRSDYDQTHTPMFHQVEGIWIDQQTHMGHLKGCLIDFVHTFFENKSIPIRFRANHFPFTEPSAELDIGYGIKDGMIRIGEGDKWLEILGCGMMHPNVLRACDTDPDSYQGFAFGIGIERLAMLKYGIPDLRTFFQCDLRWMRHYGFLPYDTASSIRGLGL